MNYKIVNASISYGADTILEEINFEIKEKDKIAIVGRNGSGKTTLLKAIVDNSMLEEGIGESKFAIYKQGTPKIGYLKQIEFENSSSTMLEEILKAYQPLVELEKKINKLAEQLQTQSSSELIENYTKDLEKFEFQGGYTYQKEYETAMKKFGFSKEDQNKRIDQFSGGQKTKIAFLRLLLSKPDILLLDEPTNHLDITAIEWLEKYLKDYPKSVVIVSHDRMFLDRIVNKVYEIEYASIKEYKGNYASFEKQKKENYEKQLKDYEYQQAEIRRLKAIADRFRYKPTKAKMALSKLKKIEQMTIIQEPNKFDLKTFHTTGEVEIESGKMVLTVKDLEIGYDKPLAKLSFDLYRGQRLGIIGENGIGKSTLLKTLIGKTTKIAGDIEFGYHVQKAYFDQQMEFENQEITVFDDFSNHFPKLTTTEARTILGTFLFSGDDVFKKIKMLSGGEKSRLHLCEILTKKPNLLLLDEPTNHMDIVGKESLEEILLNYQGTILFVSHDRYFVNKLADSILEFEPTKVTFFQGTYQEYVSHKEKLCDQPNKEERQTKVQEVKKTESENKNQYLLKKQNTRIKNKINKIEAEIVERENRIKILQSEMLKDENCSDYIKLKDLQDEIQKLNAEIERFLLEWEKLNWQ